MMLTDISFTETIVKEPLMKQSDCMSHNPTKPNTATYRVEDVAFEGADVTRDM
jgi:hypothetical protein